LTLLVVEDEPLIRIELADVLSDMGYAVLEASNADAAIRYLETRPEIVAVITDLSMPGSLDGLALARIVRERWPPCALIMLSGHRRPAEAESPTGMRFLPKPVASRSLERTLGELGVGIV
jgi:CheY-like chemotaxis protein